LKKSATAHNRTVYARRLTAARAPKNRSRANALCAVFLRHILPSLAFAAQSPCSGWQNVIYSRNVMRNARQIFWQILEKLLTKLFCNDIIKSMEECMADVLDYKKEYKELYLPKTVPSIIKVPEITFVAVDGKGDPNDKNGEYGKAIELLYSIQYIIKMSKKKQNTPEGYFDYVVPPLEGFWTVENKEDIKNKSKFIWTSVIRLPGFNR
jgi:hypothetical protein